MRKPRCAGGKKLAVCLLALMLLTGCSRWKVEGRTVEASPSLELLSMPAYEETAEIVSATVSSEEGPLRVDVWLDASQVMGGVNEHEDSIYPRASAKYRQGGFHYRYQDQVGWYENVLKDVLTAAEGSRTRLLRAGNERLTDDFLRSQGFDGTEEQLRSFRRDLLTYAVDPMPDVFSAFSSEKMTDSFYALGSPLMNQMERFAGDGGALLENPGRVEQMSKALQDFIAAFHQKKQEPPAEYSAVEKDDDSPLFYPAKSGHVPAVGRHLRPGGAAPPYRHRRQRRAGGLSGRNSAGTRRIRSGPHGGTVRDAAGLHGANDQLRRGGLCGAAALGTARLCGKPNHSGGYAHAPASVSAGRGPA